MAENVLPWDDNNGRFDILGWWKCNESKYPILAKVARDVLAIPVSTVASEFAFSTGGRVVDPHRSSLDPESIEALICAQDWIRYSKPGMFILFLNILFITFKIFCYEIKFLLFWKNDIYYKYY